MVRFGASFAAPSSQLALALVLGVSTAAAHAQHFGEAGTTMPLPTVQSVPAPKDEPISAMDRAMERFNPEAMIGQVVGSIDMAAVATMLERSLAQAALGQAAAGAEAPRPSPEAEAMQKQMAAQMQVFSRSLMVALAGMIRPMLMGLLAEMRESFRQK